MKKLSKLLLSIVALILILVPLLLNVTPISATTAPTITSYQVMGYGDDWVILKGYISDDQSNTINNVGFEYGATTAYGTSVNQTVSLRAGSYFVMTIRSLTKATVYHWRAFGSYAGSTVGNGDDAYFSTKGSPVLQEYLNTGYDNNTAAIYGLNFGAMQYTTTTNAHTITTVRVAMKRYGSPGTVNLAIRHATTGLPTGVDTITFTSINGNNLSTSYSWVTFTISSTSTQVSTEGGTQYSVVISALNGDASNYVMCEIDDGGSLANAVASHSTDGGISWTTDSPKDMLFEVWGNPAFSIVSAKQFDSYLVSGDMLFVFEYINVYPPYTSVTDPTRYFNLQLLNTDGTTVIGVTPMRAWGDRPGSIYINASVATSITKGSAFYINMIGTFAGTPSTMYQMQASDWMVNASPSSTHTDNFLLNLFDNIVGSTDGFSYLDQWVLATAYSIDSYYGYTGANSLLTYISNKGQVLAQATGGDAIFLNGIPSLSSVRPKLFEVITATIPIDTTTYTNAYGNNSENVFSSNVGTTVTGDMDAIGALFGITASPATASSPSISVAQKVFGTLLLLIAVALALFGMLSAGTGFSPVALFLSMPILFWGAQIRAIDLRLIALVIFILFFWFVRKYIWVEG